MHYSEFGIPENGPNLPLSHPHEDSMRRVSSIGTDPFIPKHSHFSTEADSPPAGFSSLYARHNVHRDPLGRLFLMEKSDTGSFRVDPTE